MGIFGKPSESKSAEPAVTPRPAPPSLTHHSTPSTAAPSPASRPSTAAGTCVIGAKTAVKGEITGDEDVLVEGRVEGQIRITRDLRVGPTGAVKAKVEAQTVIVSGEIVGDCQAATRVEIQASGKLTGNIKAPKIIISEGAMFRGNSDMSGRKGDERGAKVVAS
jgi:cytoskeletal protein CcmA (bactofilin family)